MTIPIRDDLRYLNLKDKIIHFPGTSEGIKHLAKEMIELKLLNEYFEFTKEFLSFVSGHMSQVEEYKDNYNIMALIDAYIQPKWLSVDQLMSMNMMFYVLDLTRNPSSGLGNSSIELDKILQTMKGTIESMRPPKPKNKDEKKEGFHERRRREAYWDLKSIKEGLLINGWKMNQQLRKEFERVRDEYTEEYLSNNFSYYNMLKGYYEKMVDDTS